MIPALKAELRKLITVRSTYVIFGLILVLLALFAGYGMGYKASPESLADPAYLHQVMLQSVSAVSLLLALVGILLVVNEYRYNTILYAIGANRRSHVLLAKICTVTAFGVIGSLIIMGLAVAAAISGAHIAGHQLGSQSLQLLDTVGRGLAYGIGYSLFGVLFAVLIRNQVGTIMAFVLIPGTVESLLGLLLKDNAKYLPFTALQAISGNGPNLLSTGQGLLVTAAYLIVGWAIAWWLFLQRDAK